MRREAQKVKHPEVRKQLLDIAQQYERLAESIERLFHANWFTSTRVPAFSVGEDPRDQAVRFYGDKDRIPSPRSVGSRIRSRSPTGDTKPTRGIFAQSSSVKQNKNSRAPKDNSSKLL